jgi:error-prone DNA polymerase
LRGGIQGGGKPQLQKPRNNSEQQPKPLDRRNALWDVRGLMSDKPLPLFDAFNADPAGPDVPAQLPDMPLSEHVVADYQTSRLSLKAHPMSFLRGLYEKQRMIAAKQLFACRHGEKVTVAGVVLVRQRPGTAKGVVFMTLEDETGVANIVVWKKLMEQYRKEVMQARLVAVEGIVQRAGDVIHVVARRVIDRTHDLALLAENGVTDFAAPLARADEVARPVDEDGRVKRMRAKAGALSNNQPLPVLNNGAGKTALPSRGSHPRNVRVIPKSRDFH